MEAGSNNPETGELTAQAKISEEFVLKNADGSFDYEIIDIGNGKGRNILKFDIDKIMRKADAFINAEVAGLLSSEQEEVLPLSQEHKMTFGQRYLEYFKNNYLNQFITNKLPTVEEDAAVFDLEEGKKAKAQKFIDDNKLS